MNDTETDDVPGTVLLIQSKKKGTGEPELLDGSSPSSSRPSTTAESDDGTRASTRTEPQPKTTDDGIILEPQPDNSVNDPLNWPAWKRDLALSSLGLICMLGGGMTAILAAGFSQISKDYGVSVAQVSLTTGCYMLGMGIGSVIFSPTAIVWGKRPVYLLGGVLFVISAIWCAVSPNYASLIVARIFQGISVSPVECLPSATISEIYFLHERAFRLGVYTFLLLGGKNLIPLIGAIITAELSWRWVFWIVAILVSVATLLLFLFLPETFWSRAPKPQITQGPPCGIESQLSLTPTTQSAALRDNARHSSQQTALDRTDGDATPSRNEKDEIIQYSDLSEKHAAPPPSPPAAKTKSPTKPDVSNLHSSDLNTDPEKQPTPITSSSTNSTSSPRTDARALAYTTRLSTSPKLTYLQTLRPINGRLRSDRWLHAAARPFILFTYPAILYSSLLYALSIGWLITISEVLDTIYRGPAYPYHFTTLQSGLVYISPFVGGIFGTVIAGWVSDKLVRTMAARNGGVYEPEFRLVMGVPILISTAAGLMGFGWAASERDAWIVPTVFFGVAAFGCTLGSTTAVTFAVDSYKEFAGEALVTLNFSKSEWCIMHNAV